MVSGISGRGGALRSHGSGDAQSLIDSLLAQITSLRKRMVSLTRKLMETTDPALRIELMKEIAELELAVRMLEQRIAQLQDHERKKEIARQHAHAVSALAQQNND